MEILPHILFVLLILTGVLWFLDRFFARKRRPPGAPDPGWVEWGAAFFPVVLIVFVLRSFVVEPFKIPSSSMVPTLMTGDFILVNKYAYGIRLPIINKKIISIGLPERGDIMVFRYPKDPSINFIKRVVGVPGDVIEYQDHQLTINSEPVRYKDAGMFAYHDFDDPNSGIPLARTIETLGRVEHQILKKFDPQPDTGRSFDGLAQGNCGVQEDRFKCTVPAGHYFMMGDNRDNSEDSRVWGFMPEENVVGRAYFVWANFSDWSRVGSIQ